MCAKFCSRVKYWLSGRTTDHASAVQRVGIQTADAGLWRFYCHLAVEAGIPVISALPGKLVCAAPGVARRSPL